MAARRHSDAHLGEQLQELSQHDIDFDIAGIARAGSGGDLA
jgi:hypothetical protein